MASRSLGYNVTAVDRASETFVKMAVQVERLAKRLDALDGKRARVTVDADTGGAHRKIQTLDKSFGAATIRIAALGRAMGALALPGAIVAASPAIASLGASAVTASGALWLLPAAAAAGGVAFGALKVGTAGFGDAMKNLGDPAKFAEAIAKLSPAARNAATAIQSMAPAWSAMQQTVQERLFVGIGAKMSALSEDIIPMLGSSFGLVADGANRAAGGVLGMLNTTSRLADLDAIVTASAGVWTNLLAAVQPLVGAFLDIAAVGAPILAQLTAGAGAAATGFAQFVANARQTGQLESWIRGGLDVLRQLGQLSANVGSILGSVFGAAARSGESFLGMLVRVTGTMAAALKTPEGAAGLTTFFETVRTLVGLLWDRLVQLWPVIVAGGKAFAALALAAAPVSTVIFDLVVAGLVPLLNTVKFLAPVLGPLIPIVLAVAGAAKLWALATGAVTAAMTAYRTAVGIATAASVAYRLAMGTNLVLTEAQAAAQSKHTVATYAGAAAAKVAAAASAVWSAAQWVVTAALNGTLFSLVAQKVAMVASAAASLVVRGATAAWAATQWLLNAALSANPIGLVVIAIAALVGALIYAWNNSETFRVIVIAAWTAVKVAAVAVFTFLRNFFVGTWTSIRDTAVTVWSFISGFFSAAFAAYSALFSAVWSGIVSVFSATWSFLRNTAVSVWSSISAFFVTAFNVYVAFFSAVWSGILAFFTSTWSFLRNTAVTIWSAISAFFVGAFAVFSAFFSATWSAILSIFTSTWGFLRNTAVSAWTFIYNFFVGAFAVFSQFFSATWSNIVGTFDRIWSGIVSIAQRVWTAVRGAFVHGINVIIRVINGFAGAINRVASLLGFNINLGIPEVRADGGQIEAIRRALGGPISADVIPRAAGGGVNAAAGGRLPATGTLRDTLPALAGGQRYLLQGKEWIIRSGASAALGADKMAMINQADRRPVDVVPRGVMERVAHYAQGGPIPMASAGQIAAAASALVPGSRMSSGFRRGDPGMHGRNQAADMTGNLGAINRAWAQRYGPSTDQLIYTPGINLLNGRGHTYNAGTRADHYDHVHIGYSGQLGLPGGGFFDPGAGGRLAQLIRPIVDGLLNPLRDRLRPIRDNQAEGLGNRMVAGVGLKLLDHLFAKADEKDAANAASNGMDVSGISGPVVEQVRQVAHRYGWGAGPQWDALSRLIQKESGWNPNAANPRSSARGLFQKMTSIHGPVEPTAAGQAAWGLNYIRGRYRDPIGALGFHNRNNYYDQGGVASGRGLMWKETIRPERVLDPDMTRTFDRFTDWLGSTTARQLLSTQTAGRRSGVTVNVDSPALVAELAKLRADVKALQGGGATIHVEDRSGNPTETARAAQLALRLAR